METCLAPRGEERRGLWEPADVVVDDLASRVLVLSLPAEGRADFLIADLRLSRG